MVFQHQVYATGHSRGSSRLGSAASSGGHHRPQVALPRSQKEFLEQHILRKREAEVKRSAYWTQTSDYFGRLARQSERYNQLTSPEVTRTSLEASSREADTERRKQNLLGRRQRLKALLAAENEEYQAEMDRLPSGSKPITDLRLEREKMRKEREEVMKKEAELKMLQHWKINNSQFRDQEKSINNYNVRQQLQEQIQQKKDREEQQRQEQEEISRRMVEEEQRKIQETLRAEEDRKEELAKLHKHLEQQMEDLRTRQREMEVWRRTRAEQEELQRRVEVSDRERRQLEAARAGRELATFNKRQHRLKLRSKAKQVQEDLEEDKRRLAEMEAMTRAQDDCHEERKKKAVEDVRWMQEVIRQQQEEETRREKELEMMFAEEASRMWDKQEEVWAREEEARRKLMEEVSSSWRQQMDKRTEAAKLVVDHETQRMAEIEADIRDLHHHIQDKERRQEQTRESLVAALDAQVRDKQQRRAVSWAAQEADTMARRQQEIREENQLARNLAQLSLSADTEAEAGTADYRRRKVRWYY